MKRALTATAGGAVIAGAGIGWTWRQILRDFDRIADGPDIHQWDQIIARAVEHPEQHLDNDTGWDA